MPIEMRELHIRVVVQDTSEATLGPSGSFAVEGDTSLDKDHDHWVNVTSVNMGGHKSGGGAAGDDAPTEPVSFADAQVEVQHESGGGFLFQADANTGMFCAVAQDDPFHNGDGSVRFIQDSIDGGVWTGGGRDVLIGGAGADHIDAGASTGHRGHLVVGVDDVHLMAQVLDGFDLV